MQLKAESVYVNWSEAVKEAKKSVTIFAPYWDSFLLDILDNCDRDNSALIVTIVTTLDERKYYTSRGAFEALKKVVEENKYRVKAIDDLHAKVLVVDGRIISCGSQNFTNNSHFTMKEITAIFDNTDLVELEFQNAKKELSSWEKKAIDIDCVELKFIEENLEKYKAYCKEKNHRRRKKNIARRSKHEGWKDARIDSGYIKLADGGNLSELVESKGLDASKTEWMTLLDANNNYKLYFVRMNERSLSLAFSELEMTIPSNISTRYYKVRVISEVSNKFNVLLEISINDRGRDYKAQLQLSFYGGEPEFVPWRSNIIKWVDRRVTKELREELQNFIEAPKNSQSSSLMNYILEAFKPKKIHGEFDLIGEQLQGKVNQIQLLEFDNAPVWVVR
ncbi:phospholipase D-like domain-containing protein [Photobacterium sp. GSS17]|uniref:phospholipase D-like domain-containing protein n=1 Tax=Photobacterium sp. GSS17 TaxID=3020715 RepID=UPI002360D58C|nr:phospholipase D-like domain-containing protein [Photobacterium sp. GSS17]